MTLDLAKVSPQIRALCAHTLGRRDELRQRREYARATLRELGSAWEALRDLAEQRERNQRLASPRGPLDARIPLPACPPGYRVIATDGSQIEPDRHGPVEFFLINIGWAVLTYGQQPAADLASEPSLAFEPDALYIRGEPRGRRVPVQGSHLAALRAVRELEAAARLAAEPSGEEPLVVLQDGTLLLWVLEERPEDFLREAFLRPYVEAMARCQERGWPLASYVSRPRSTEVAALLRAATCGGDATRCASLHPLDGAGCPFDGLPDRELFEDLEEGERSTVFAVTLHEKLEAYYGGQRVHFFYLQTGKELARVEVPEWVASDAERLALVHAVVYDQCQRGQGYPVALTRAHEQAVVRAADRAQLLLVLERQLAQYGLVLRSSEKASAKRLRAV